MKLSIKQINNKKMKIENKVNTAAPQEATFPPALVAAGIALVKVAVKTQLKFALLWADAILAGHDGQELITACFVAAGYGARDARAVKTNASKFVAPALLFRGGKMTEKEFFALKMPECAPIFKARGGMEGEGLNPDQWQKTREDLAHKENEKEKTPAEARPQSGGEAKATLSAFEVLKVAIRLRRAELSGDQIDELIEILRS